MEVNQDQTEWPIGIDLGTTFSCVGVWRNNKVEILLNEHGKRITPSCVAFLDKEDHHIVGDAAVNHSYKQPANTIFDAKRLIGRKFSDKQVQDDIQLWPFKVDKDENDKPLIQVDFKGEVKNFHAEEISAFVLVKMKEIAEKNLGSTI